MRKVVLSLVLMLTMPVLIYAQETYVHDNFLYGISLGMSNSTFRHPVIKYSPGQMFSVGAFGEIRIWNDLWVKSSLIYAPKRSITEEHFYKITRRSLDFIVMPQFRLFDGLTLQAGYISSQLFSKTFRKANGDMFEFYSFNSLSEELRNPLPTEVNLLAGVEIRLQKNINLELNYQIPLGERNTSSFQATLNFILNKSANPQKSRKKIKRELAKEQIQELKGGTLLVRLKTAENTIAALEQTGHTEEAAERKAFREKKNREIMSAFRENYDFSKIAFFYSIESIKVKEGKFEGIFLNDQLQYDPSITIDTAGAVFIGEFDVIEPDTAKYESYKYFDTNKKRMETAYYGTPSNYSFTSLVIRDQNFIQLRDPFPYYTSSVSERQKGSLENKIDATIRWTVAGAVKTMNKRLHRYYYRVSRYQSN